MILRQVKKCPFSIGELLLTDRKGSFYKSAVSDGDFSPDIRRMSVGYSVRDSAKRGQIYFTMDKIGHRKIYHTLNYKGVL